MSLSHPKFAPDNEKVARDFFTKSTKAQLISVNK